MTVRTTLKHSADYCAITLCLNKVRAKGQSYCPACHAKYQQRYRRQCRGQEQRYKARGISMAETGKPVKRHVVIPLLPGHKIDAPEDEPRRAPAPRVPAPAPKHPRPKEPAK